VVKDDEAEAGIGEGVEVDVDATGDVDVLDADDDCAVLVGAKSELVRPDRK
jgi:hypothetical protein